ncbi:hypothetical protein F383_20384 [Gossypium arboreum]|uniref:Uncharacterized protein n=1 Tax=Gossypium arboreum TaxID=29729 RepID=A0A0B0NLR8_GOSAR|nr:hypothetical protein F383_20384 [Gossypium arboreum]
MLYMQMNWEYVKEHMYFYDAYILKVISLFIYGLLSF